MLDSIQINMQSPDDHHNQGQGHGKTPNFFAILNNNVKVTVIAQIILFIELLNIFNLYFDNHHVAQLEQ